MSWYRWSPGDTSRASRRNRPPHFPFVVHAGLLYVNNCYTWAASHHRDFMPGLQDRSGAIAMTTERRRGTVSLRQVSGSARSRKVRADLGEESSFSSLPAPVKVGDASYFLVRGRDGYKLLSTVCPHQGGEIMDEGDELFVCDGHGWQYEKGRASARPARTSA